MRINVFDCEGNGLKPTKIWCISANFNGKIKTTDSYEKMRSFLQNAEVLVGHNIIRWDIPNLERVLDIKITAKLVDTLAISWYIEPYKVIHGLEAWGEYFGVPKPPIPDWDNLPLEDYMERCEEDVKINTKLWDKQWKQLLKLYGSAEEVWRFIDYLMFKMDCARQQEKNRWKLDKGRCSEGLAELIQAKEEKVVELAALMPKVPVKAKKARPKKCFKQCGSESVTGSAWFALLKERNLPRDYDGVLEVVTSYKEPNPGSSPQLKSWLYSLGWKPITFEYKRNKDTNETRKIEQINLKHGQGLCQSVKELYQHEPNLKVLEGLSILTHRISILNGFLNTVDEDGYIQAQIQGFTNTLRFRHKVVLNLPGVDKAYGELIRGCLICPGGYELCGADMSSLEDRTKQHYMWKHDPDYVRDMMTPDFDPHIDLATFSGALDPLKAKGFKEKTLVEAIKKEVGAVRKVYKQVNYACVYGAGGPTVARSAGVSEHAGYILVEKYWLRNWSVKAIAEEQITKTCHGTKWLFNPVSRFWYSLRHEKDRFSTLNQGTGVYCFDMWIKHCQDGGPPIIGQMHDEGIWLVRTGIRDKVEKHLRNAIHYTNEELQLNRELDIDVQFGMSYADIH
ncbi:DNA polymerase [bacterium]|nr:DNA polymerase [bacterium]